jgi:hypothetical protein
MSISGRCFGVVRTFGGLCLLVAGCAHVQAAGGSADTAAKQFTPDPEGNGFGDTLVANCQMDGLYIGGLAPDTYLLVTAAPGHHILVTSGPTNEESAELDAVAGQNYFFDVSITYAGPMMRHRHITAESDADGRKYVLKETRAQGATAPPAGGQ